jgi:hypothetical protein
MSNPSFKLKIKRD